MNHQISWDYGVVAEKRVPLCLSMEAASARAEEAAEILSSSAYNFIKNRKRLSTNSCQQEAAGYVGITDFTNTYFTERQKHNPPPLPFPRVSAPFTSVITGYIRLVTLHSTVARLRDGSPSPATMDSVGESRTTPPDAWLPHGLHSGRALWFGGWRLFPAVGFFPSYAPLTNPFSTAEAEV